MDEETRSAHPVRDVLARLEEVSDDPEVSLGTLIAAFGEASFAPALMVPALLVVSPLSGIPFFSSLCGLTIALIALQMLVSNGPLWLPQVLMRRRIGSTRLHRAMRQLHRVADWLDRSSRDRLRPLVFPPGIAVAQALAVICGASMPFLELLPFSSSILGMAVLMFSVGFLARDGLFVLVGCGFMALATVVPIVAITWLAD